MFVAISPNFLQPGDNFYFDGDDGPVMVVQSRTLVPKARHTAEFDVLVTTTCGEQHQLDMDDEVMVDRAIEDDD